MTNVYVVMYAMCNLHDVTWYVISITSSNLRSRYLQGYQG